MAACQPQPEIRILICVTLLFMTTQLSTQSCADDLYIIRSRAPNGLVLDASDHPNQITLEHYTGWSPQLWKLERTNKDASLIYIINYYTGLPLDFVKRDSDGRLLLVTRARQNNKRQQWNLTIKGRITNAENGKNVDVFEANFTAGISMNVWKDNGFLAQDFVLQKIIKDNNN